MDSLWINLIPITVGVLLLVEIIWPPRIDITRERDVLLFYGKRHRNFIKLFRI